MTTDEFRNNKSHKDRLLWFAETKEVAKYSAFAPPVQNPDFSVEFLSRNRSFSEVLIFSLLSLGNSLIQTMYSSNYDSSRYTFSLPNF